MENGWAEISINGLNLDLRTGTANRDVVNYLINAGVEVYYEDGNIID